MPKFPVAHLRQQGVDLIIVPLESHFGSKNRTEQDEIVSELQVRAKSAGLTGAVVPVWNSGGGRMAFIAPQQWHPYFRSISLQYVQANVNRELYW